MSVEQGFIVRKTLDINFGTRLSVCLIEGVRLVGGPLNRDFTVELGLGFPYLEFLMECGSIHTSRCCYMIQSTLY